MYTVKYYPLFDGYEINVINSRGFTIYSKNGERTWRAYLDGKYCSHMSDEFSCFEEAEQHAFAKLSDTSWDHL